MYRTLLFICLSLLASVAEAKTYDKEETGRLYAEYCQFKGATKEACDCSFDAAVIKIGHEKIVDVIIANKAGRPANPDALNTLDSTRNDCIAGLQKSAALPPAVTLPAPPTATQNTVISIPAPPDINKVNKEMEKITDKPIDYEENFLAQIKPQKLPPQERAERTQRTTNYTDERAYFGEYDDLYFRSIERNDWKAIRSITPYLDTVDIKNAAGETPLQITIRNGQWDIVSFLLENGASPNAKNNNGETPLHMAVYAGQVGLVQEMLKNKADVNAEYSGGITPLDLAIMSGNNDIARMIIATPNLKINHKLKNGNTALHLAAYSGNANILAALLQKKPNLNLKNIDGFTPLMLAAYVNAAPCVQALVAAKADIRIRNPEGYTAADLAQTFGAAESFNILALRR